MANLVINSEQFNKILNFANDKKMNFETFFGSLQDEAIIYTENKKLLKNTPKTKYIILKEKYLNSWNSAVEVIFTNSDKKAFEFVQNREKETI